MQIDAPFARLPLRFDPERLAAEVRQFDRFEWVPDRFNMPGYWSIDLISSLGRSMDFAVHPFGPTAHLRRCPYIRQALAALPGVYYEARLRWLEPGARVGRHYDGQYEWIHRPRLHIPVITPDGAMFVVGDKKIHMAAGEVWLFDRFSYHTAENETASDRIHLVMDLTPDPAFFDLLASAYKPFATSRDSGAVEGSPRLVAFAPDTSAVLRTEQVADGPGRSPGEVDDMTFEMVRWMRRNPIPIHDESRAGAVERELERFRIMWRYLWIQFGCTEEGWPEYLALGKATLARLRELEEEDDRALLPDDVAVWKRLRDYLYTGLLSFRGIVPKLAPDTEPRFLVPDLLFRFDDAHGIELFVPSKGEFVAVDGSVLMLIAEVAVAECLPDSVDAAEVQRLLDWEILLPRGAIPRPAQSITLDELGVGGRMADTELVTRPAAISPARAAAAASVGFETRLRLVGPSPHHARLRWRGIDASTELLMLHENTFTSVAPESLGALLQLTDWISVRELAERLQVSVDEDSLAGIRSLVLAGVVECSGPSVST